MQFLGVLGRASWLSAKVVKDSKWDGMGWLQQYGRFMYIANENEAAEKFLKDCSKVICGAANGKVRMCDTNDF